MYTRLGDFFFLKHFINGVEWVSKTNNIFFFFLPDTSRNCLNCNSIVRNDYWFCEYND